jgi:hypothetical protein
MAKRASQTSTPEVARLVRRGLEHGRGQAEAIQRRRRGIRRRTARALGEGGLLVAEGDSWFDYPLDDVLQELELNFDFDVESAAHMGDMLESMAYEASQHTDLVRIFERLERDGRRPRAILLSGGGNDIAGEVFGFLLNHIQSGLAPLNDRIIDGVVEQRLRFAMVSLIAAVTKIAEEHLGQTIPVILHGYDYAVPDGRGFLGGFWLLPGPWLKPGFEEKGYDVLKDTTRVMVQIIDRYNEMLASLPTHPGLRHVTYLDLRRTLSNDPRYYKNSWGNELHPTRLGFGRVAEKFYAVISGLPMP